MLASYPPVFQLTTVRPVIAYQSIPHPYIRRRTPSGDKKILLNLNFFPAGVFLLPLATSFLLPHTVAHASASRVVQGLHQRLLSSFRSPKIATLRHPAQDGLIDGLFDLHRAEPRVSA